ncbi:MAG TPA: DUF5335 family protein [Thermoanaerobaculia bacterium]|nr:DUF5335 family protein [Thermoanaerobaculia bacterium]
MSKTREIPRNEWTAFLDAFSRAHKGWRARLEIFGVNIGAQEEVDHLPLMGLTAELGRAGRERITIDLGREADDHVSHAILHPSRIRILQTDAGADEALEIEAGEAPPTLLRFLAPSLPEAVDGAVPELETTTRD